MAQIIMNKEHTVRGKKYKAMVSFTKDGRRKRFSKTFDTKKEATQWAASLESEKANGTNYDMSDTLFHQWFWLWFKTYREDHISSSTRVSYRNTREKLKQLLPNVKVNKLTRPLIQTFFDSLDLSKGTKRKMLNHIRASLKDAVLDGVINKNPATRIQINADKSLTKKEADKFLSDSDFTRVRDSLFNRDYKFQDSKDMALLVVACTGCRIGEVLDLQFGDVNYDTSEIKIDSSWDRLTRSSKEPKTENSNRIIKISSTLLQKLKRWESVVKQELIRRGKQNDVTHLFLNSELSVINETTVNSRFKVIQKKLGIVNTISQHGLRHNVASRLLNNDIPVEYVSAYLGHSSIAVTQKFYAHLLPEKKVLEDERMMELLG